MFVCLCVPLDILAVGQRSAYKDKNANKSRVCVLGVTIITIIIKLCLI